MENERAGKDLRSKGDELLNNPNRKVDQPLFHNGMIEENRELCRIFTSSLKTARTRKR